MTALMSLDDDLEKLQSYSQNQVLEYLDINLPTLIDCLRNSKLDPADAVKSACIVFDHCLPCFESISKAENQILITTWPLLEDLYQEIFDNIEKQLENHMIDVVEGLLQVIITLVGCTRSCVQFYTKFENLLASDMENFCKSVFSIILKALHHCSNSSAIYGSFAESLLQDLGCLLKEVGDLVTKIIFLFKDVVLFNLEEREYEVLILASVTRFFGEVGILSQVLGVRTMTESWKLYTALTGKYAQNLTSVISVDEPVKHLVSEVSRLAILTNEQVSDLKTAERTVKVASFMLRLLISLLETGYSKSVKNSCSSIVELLVHLQSFSEISCKLAGVEVTPCTQMIDRQVVVGVSSIVAALAENSRFSKHILDALAPNKNNEAGQEPICEVLLASIVLQELSNVDSSVRGHWITQENNIFKTHLQLLDQCSCALNQISTNPSIYETSLTSSFALAATLSAEEFLALEKTLFTTLCSSPSTPWPWIFASDLWVCVIRSSGSQLCLEHINILRSSVEPLDEGPQKRAVSTLVQRLVQILPQSQKPASFDTDLTQDEVQLMEKRLKNFVDTPTVKVFDQTLDTLELMKLKRANSQLLQPLLQLLPFLSEGKYGEKLGVSVLATSAHYASLMENKQLVTVISQFCLFSSSALRIGSIEFLSSLAKRKLASDDDQKTVIRLIAEAFNDLLQHFNPVIQQEALTAFAEFACVSPHEDVVSLTVKNSIDLQRKAASYVQKAPCASKTTALQEIKRLSKFKRLETNEIKIELGSQSQTIPNFSSLNDDNFFDLDEEDEAHEIPYGSQFSTKSAPHSPILTKEHKEVEIGESEGSQGPEFSSQSQVSLPETDIDQENSEPLILELSSLVDSLIKTCKKSELAASDKNKVRNSILKLQGLLADS